jgi:hypothetical protein
MCLENRLSTKAKSIYETPDFETQTFKNGAASRIEGVLNFHRLLKQKQSHLEI